MNSDKILQEFSDWLLKEAEDEGLNDGAFQEANYIRRKLEEMYTK